MDAPSLQDRPPESGHLLQQRAHNRLAGIAAQGPDRIQKIDDDAVQAPHLFADHLQIAVHPLPVRRCITIQHLFQQLQMDVQRPERVLDLVAIRP
jgi:hypothetical protein